MENPNIIKCNAERLQEAVNFAVEQIGSKSTTIKMFNHLVSISIVKENPIQQLSNVEGGKTEESLEEEKP